MRRSITTASSTPRRICLMRFGTGTTGACEACQAERKTQRLTMTIKIDRKIIKYQVQKPEDQPQDKAPDKASEARAAAAQAAPEARGAAAGRAPQPGQPGLAGGKNGHTPKVNLVHGRLPRPDVPLCSP